MNAIALKLVGDVGWGLKLRVFVGAALSTLDWVTDIYITYTFWKDGKEIFYKSSAAMLGTSMLLILLTVLAQNWKLGMNRVLLETIPVVVGLKPAVDAYRVASGTNQEEGQLFDPLGEMVSQLFVLSWRCLISSYLERQHFSLTSYNLQLS